MSILTNKAASPHRMAITRIVVCLALCLMPVFFVRAQERVYQYFHWNDAEWTDDYFGNGAIIDSLCALIDRIGPENIEVLDVVAYASPEGIYENNVYLSQKRAAQFERLRAERLPALSANVKAGGEAWALLRERVANDTKIRPDLQEAVLRILDDPSIGNDTRKWRLANRLEDSDYRYLLYAHYRYLRCVEIVISVKERGPIPEPEPVLQPEPEPLPEPEPAPEEPEVEVVQEIPVVEPEFKPVPVKKKPVLAISTNIPYDITFVPGYGFTSIPSMSLEYYPSAYGHWTFGADVEFPMWRDWDAHRFLQIQNLTMNTRYYFKRGDYHGLYLLANVNAARYGIGWNAKGWEGEGLGVSAGIGYKLTLYKRLFLDAGFAVGYFHSRYDPYEYGFDATRRYYYDYVGVPDDFVRRNHSLDWFGPTRAWISIGVELFGRKVEK